MIIIKETCTKGTNIYLGNGKRRLINDCINYLMVNYNFQEIQIPILQEYKYFENKVGKENNNMMYRLSDKGNRDLCLAPEYTSIIMNLENTFKYQKDVKLFYIQECFRGENPQKGRYRQFTQLGIEIINPSQDYLKEGLNLQFIAMKLCNILRPDLSFIVNENVKRGLDYYNNGQGFEIRTENGDQIVGGGAYKNGQGFAIGIDRLLNI